ncbi:PAS domain-containing sensor histidine kinase [Bacillus sp. FJAT-42376]|uniref:PAS domain-containing sensor histidine kinase n=1 Tax=Bacillus sp. FJAT-42376 TaxID=2014076 RepID=UPI000F515F79|nr:PAS domain-containing sensor histidine kinase [Bacillus sp. FJAT-42376]AZB42750.1 PAS domain-containing sensor histidine kinase [Bacillus sp. FJAT-42376]
MKDLKMDEPLMKLFHYFFMQTNEAIVITEVTSLAPLAAHVFDCNSRTSELLGYTREEMKQLDPVSLFFGHIDPEIFRTIQGRFASDREITLEMEIVTKSKLKIPVETNCCLLELDEKTFIYTSMKKIDRRKEAFDRLLSEKEFSHTIMDTIQAFVVLLDSEGRIADWNRHCTFHTGYTFEEASGEYIWNLMLEEGLRAEAKEFFSRSIRPFPAFYENYWITKSGEKMLIRWSNQEIFSQDGETQYIVCTGIDLTENKQYEKRLAESHTTFKRLVEHNPDGIIIYQDHTLSYMNPEAEKMLGLSCLQANGSILNLIHPQEQTIAYHSLQSLLNQDLDIAGPIEFNINRKDGRTITVEAKGISDRSQNQSSVIVVMRDVTPRKKAEFKFKNMFNQMKDILSSSVEGILGIDEQKGVIFVNRALSVLTDMELAEIMGKSVRPFLLKLTDPASVDLLLEANEAIEIKIEKDGKIKYFELSSNLMANGRGQVITFYDQTDRILLENAKNKYYEAIACGITVQNSEGAIVFANECATEILGYSSSELLNMSSHSMEWHSKDEHGKALSGIEHPSMITLRTKKEVSHFVMGVYNPVKRENRWILIDTRILYADQTKEVEYIIATFQDITEKAEMDKTIKSQEKLALAGRMATAVAHEIRNPLTSIIGFLQLMEMSDELNTEYLRIMKQELDRIRLVTNEFLTLAKPESADCTRLDVKEDLLDPVIRVLLPDLHDREISVELLAEKEGPSYVDGRKDSLQQLFLNFLTNSMDAMPNKGKISIEITEEARHLKISIEDTGIGIDPDRLPFLGEPFYSIKEKGTGLGLLICRKILDDHTGNFTISSTQGKGTKVLITLPLSIETEMETA